ncbi:hypothetical protein D3C87_1283300 [compost metagenome]
MRGLIENQRARLLLYLLQTRTATHGLGREEAFEDETVRRQARGRQRRNQCTGTRHRHHIDPRGTGLTHQVITWVGNQRRPGIGDQRHIVTGQQARNKAATFIPLVVFMAGRQRRGNAEVLHQPLRVAGVFGGNQGHLAQDLQCPRTDVVQVADGRRHHIKRASSGIQSTWSSQSAHLMIGKSRHCSA